MNEDIIYDEKVSCSGGSFLIHLMPHHVSSFYPNYLSKYVAYGFHFSNALVLCWFWLIRSMRTFDSDMIGDGQ